MIKAIVACDPTGGIGLDGAMPWPHNKVDLWNFQALTIGHAVVMGSKTWSSLPKSLVNRTQYVLTTQETLEFKKDNEPKLITGDLENILPKLSLLHDTVWIMGGADIYKQAWESIQEWNITIHPKVYASDVYIDLEGIYDEFTLVDSYIMSELEFQTLRKNI